jgi:hypothetical protein
LYSYCICGLKVASEIDLPGLIAFPPGAPDVTIRLGAIPASLEGASEIHPTYEVAGDLFLLRIPHVANFLLCGGSEMVVEAAEGTPAAEVAIFIIGTVFGVLLHQRRQIVLHASAVRVNGKAVLFCGYSGAGKSTIAAALGQRGYALMTDDVCAITLRGGEPPLVQPDGRLLKLWSQAIDQLKLGARRGAAVRHKLEKFYVDPAANAAEALPLGAVYILRETRPPLRDGIERLNIVDSARHIRSSAYRPRLVRVLHQAEHYLRASPSIMGKTGIFALTRPLDFAQMPEVVTWLEAHWRALKLAGDAP